MGYSLMARLCIRITPNPNLSNPSMDALRTKVGDVVCLVDDSHIFSVAELTCGHYRFIDVPGVSQEDLVHLVTPVKDKNGRMTKRRAQSLDPAALKAGIWVDKDSATISELDLITSVKV